MSFNPRTDPDDINRPTGEKAAIPDVRLVCLLDKTCQQDHWRRYFDAVFSSDLTEALLYKLLAFDVLLLLKTNSFMKFNIEVGQEEKHNVEFSFHQLTGNLEIRVDGKVVVQSKRLINEPIRETYQLTVGEQEKTDVLIEKCRRPLFGHRRRVWLNNPAWHKRPKRLFKERRSPSPTSSCESIGGGARHRSQIAYFPGGLNLRRLLAAFGEPFAKEKQVIRVFFAVRDRFHPPKHPW